MTISPELYAKLLANGLAYIEKIRASNTWDENGVLVLPFICYGCSRPRMDFQMITGDGLPMCVECFERDVDALASPVDTC